MTGRRHLRGAAPRERHSWRDYFTPAFGARSLCWPVLPFAGGVGLVAWVLTRQSMRVLVACLVLVGAALWAVGLWRLRGPGHADFRRRLITGTQAGLLATAAYDLSRFGLVSLASWSARPWAAVTVFGQLFIGPHHSQVALLATGLAYHFLVNGMGFAVAYTLIVKRPHPVTGVLWAYGLEAAMALLYPRFLIVSQYGEFLTMSVLGHSAYGLVLGWWSRRGGGIAESGQAASAS